MMNAISPSIKVRPFLKWAGGKTQLLSEIETVLPVDLSVRKNLTYIEPFIGSGAVMFWFLQRYPNVKKAIINDINPDLITACNIIKKEPKSLISALLKLEKKYKSLVEEDDRKKFFLEIREKFNLRNTTEVESTSLLIFLNRTCFNGLYRVNSKTEFNVPFGRYTNPKICDEKNILAVSNLLQRVTILNGDYQLTLKHAGKNSFFYFDPPYKPLNKTSSFNAYASEVFNDEQQERLATFCRKLDAEGHQWLLSNSDMKNENEDDNYFDNLYSGFNIKRVKAKRMINSNALKRGEIDEILINNY
jgi:DNA adenine methylase